MHKTDRTSCNHESDRNKSNVDTAAPLVIWGAKGHALALADFLLPLGHTILALFDNDQRVSNAMPAIPLHFGKEGFRKWIAGQSELDSIRSLVAIGGDRGRDRLELQQMMMDFGIAPLTSAIHPKAFVANDAKLGAGTQVMALAGVCAGVTIGSSCIINTKASVDHDCVLGDGIHLAPGATLAGCITVEDCVMIGTGAVVLPRIHIGRKTVIGAGSVVTRDIPAGVIAYGNPARVMRKNEPR
jgi:sugar O-acyltransferase (sialic acid O-acetyltransferase NeuD family)